MSQVYCTKVLGQKNVNRFSGASHDGLSMRLLAMQSDNLCTESTQDVTMHVL